MKGLTRNLPLLVICIALLVESCSEPPYKDYQSTKTAYSTSGMVVSAHPLASDAGAEILQKGGNAVDASIAVQLALAVVYPRAGNLGGGGFMVYRSADGEINTLDYRERAPMSAHRDMYLDSAGNVIADLSLKGHLAAGVPGTVAGLVEAHREYGALPFAQLVEPAIRLARRGFAISAIEADRLNTYGPLIAEFNDHSIPFVQEGEFQVGQVLIQKDLAKTLQRIASSGRDGFYTGETAEMIVSEMASGDGIITHSDLADYRALWRPAIVTEYKEYKVIGMPPPSSGGIAVAQMLELVEPYPIAKWGADDIRTIHLMAEAERRAFADRAHFLGDPAFAEVPTETLLSIDYLDQRMSDFSPDSATVSENIAAGDVIVTLESYETTHLSVVDKEGNAVSVTTTLNSNYGCKVMVDGAGFFLNNEMDDFSAKPGVPNQFGLIGNEANAIQPGKRMLSSMTPTIIEKNNEFFMTIGTPGGSTIITSVFQVFLDVVEFEMTASQAVARDRFHHQWLPDEIRHEPGIFSDQTTVTLQEMGHELREVKSIGLVEVIHRLSDGRLEGAADPRGDDSASY